MRKGQNGAVHFPTTRWSLIFSGKRNRPEQYAREPLDDICQIYWRPIYTFICRQGYSSSEAQDLTQDFFMRFLEGRLLHSADPDRGRFRSLLLKSLKNFLIDASTKTRAQKRGGGLNFVEWDEWRSDLDHLGGTDAVVACAPETMFDVRWAATIAEEALRRLREECESKGHRQLYDVLSSYLDADRDEICYKTLSVQLGAPEKSIKRLLHEFRKRFRALLREEVGKTTANPADTEDEIRYLCTVLSSLAD